MSHNALDELADDLGQLSDDPGAADDLRGAHAALAADGPNGRVLADALEWLAAQPNQSAMEKFEAIEMVLKLPRGRGPVFIPSLREFVGWNPDAEPFRN